MYIKTCVSYTGEIYMNLLAPKKSEYALLKEQAEDFLASGFLPPSFKKFQQVVLMIQLGRELNIPPLQAINGIHVIQGKPTVSPQLMLALIERSGQMKNIKVLVDEKSAKVEMTRKGREPHLEIFSMEDAKRMVTSEYVNGVKKSISLSEKHNWKAQPKTMMKWRAISACARIVFPDVLMGLYTAEEIDPSVRISEEGEILQAEVISQGVIEKPSKEVSHHSTKAILEAPKEEQKQPEKSIEKAPVIEAKTEQSKQVFGELINESQWKLPWIALGEKGYSKEDQEIWLRIHYKKYGKNSTKELTQKELNNILFEIEDLAQKETETCEQVLTRLASHFFKGKEWLKASLAGRKITFETMSQKQFEEFSKLIPTLTGKIIEEDLGILKSTNEDIVKIGDIVPSHDKELKRTLARLDAMEDTKEVSISDLVSLINHLKALGAKEEAEELEKLIEDGLGISKVDFLEVLSRQSAKNN